MAGAAWLRPVAAVAAGVMADRVRASTALTVIFLLALLTALTAAIASSLSATVLMANLLCSVAAVYALRGVYFALTAEVGVPESRTGVAVGLVSVLGFTPDIFFAPLTGRLLDAYPGLPGLQRYFWLLSVFALLGMAVSLALVWRLRHRLPPPA
jgi:MFS family permease